jgi:hypothetical protein
MTGHWEGFEKEGILQNLLVMVRQHHPDFKSDLLASILSVVAPTFMKGAFVRKPCLRKVKYIGNGAEPHPKFKNSEFFVIGKTYDTTTFNGGTYEIDGYDLPIGCNFFEVVPKGKAKRLPKP